MITSWRQSNVKNNYNIELPMKYAHSSCTENKITTFHIKEATKRCTIIPFYYGGTMELHSLIYDHFLYPERSSLNTKI